jgi:hypothetical protein
MAVALMALTVVPAAREAAPDLAALFKTDVDTESIGYGKGARSLFVTQLGSRCPDKVAGLGMVDLDELDDKQHDALLAKLRSLPTQRGDFATGSPLCKGWPMRRRGTKRKSSQRSRRVRARS